MITKLLMTIKLFPSWIKKVKRTYPLLYISVLAVPLVFLGNLINFLYFRDDYFYFLTMFLFPAFITIYQSFVNFSMPEKRLNLSSDERIAQILPILIIFIFTGFHIPFIIQGNYVPREDIYDEYFVYMIAMILELFLMLFSRFISGKVRPFLLIICYSLSMILTMISFLLAVSI